MYDVDAHRRPTPQWIFNVAAVGFEPAPLRTGALSQRLRPLGQTVLSMAPNVFKRIGWAQRALKCNLRRSGCLLAVSTETVAQKNAGCHYLARLVNSWTARAGQGRAGQGTAPSCAPPASKCSSRALDSKAECECATMTWCARARRPLFFGWGASVSMHCGKLQGCLV